MHEPLCFDSIESIYKALNDRHEIKSQALLMLMLRNWLTEVSNFDPVSGHALDTGIVDFLDAAAKSLLDESPKGEIKDRIYRIVAHTKEAVLAIMEHTRDKILREHAMLPIHAAREVDGNCVQWLSRQPGRTIREKLSGKPYMKAVRRRHSFDTSENRLLKVFLLRLEQVIFERENALDEANDAVCNELLIYIQRWLRTEDAAEIGAWGNLPPNNTLLQDKRYRKVWDGWLWLQVIDEQITGDSKRVHRDILSVIYWNTLSLLNHSGRFRTVQQPVGLDYDNFFIVPELPVCGYLFPACDAKIRGKIKFIKHDKSFGFITSDDGRDLYFKPYNLSRNLDINSLSTGDEVSFVIANNRQGECADDIALRTETIPIDFNLTGDKWNIEVGENKYLLQIISGNLVIEQAQGSKKKLKIELETLKEIPKTVLSLVTGAPFEYSATTNNQRATIRMDTSVVDLCSIRPAFTNNTGFQAHLPFRLLQQIWTLKNGTTQVLDCGETFALVLNDNIKTISMRSLFSHSSALSAATKNSASMFFTKNLSDYIQADKLTYLVPDWGNDFDLEGIRKSVNFYFNESTPLPKSIAAIFAWQSSSNFQKHEFSNKEFEVLVIDAYSGGFSITPVRGIYKDELKKKLPKTKGIFWERHPSLLIENKSALDEMSDKLSKKGCPISKQIIELFGLEGLNQEAEKLSLVKDENWFHIDKQVLSHLSPKSRTIHSSSQELKFFFRKRDKKIKTFILPANETIIIDPLLSKYEFLKTNIKLVEAGLVLKEWQEKAEDIPLWRDHLPELSIKIVHDGHFENFYLVKDATVTPQRGRTVEIPVKESFTLPAGQTHYSFPLQQGEGNKELQFVAYLKSPAFPLEKNTICKLKMTYTYGADDPYELRFIPLNSVDADFKSIRVEWRSKNNLPPIDLASLPAPPFPERKTWSDFQKFPKEDGKSFSDLLSWVEREIEEISNIANFLSGKKSKRLYDDNVIDRWNWKEDRKGKLFCYLKYDFGDIFFHESNFEEFDSKPDQISFDLEAQRDRAGYIARNITLGKSISKRTIEHFRKSLRFPALTIWNHGHSLSESEVPDHFRSAIFEGTQKIISIIESENIPDTLKEELFFFLCCLHKDAPDIVRSRLLNAVQNKDLLQKYRRNIAFAIGDAGLIWQHELLDNVIDPIDNEGLTRSITLEVLSIAFWRSEALILTLTKEEMETLTQNLYSCLEFDLQKVNDGKGYPILCKHLELLLALLRSRSNEDEKIKKILAPDQELTQKYVKLVDDISKIVIEKDIELGSRISLNIYKPETFRNTPDLLYALRMYLTGDSGANTIMITAISDEN